MAEDLRYPIGEYIFPDEVTATQVEGWIGDIETAPKLLRMAVAGLNDEQLDVPYRPEGWTARQVVHHLPDSHMNSYVRFKLALTEKNPTIRPYYEDRWAELADSRAPVDLSLDLLEALHRRWVVLLRALEPDDLIRTFEHPELGPLTVGANIGLYAWHGRHHVAHITSLRARRGW